MTVDVRAGRCATRILRPFRIIISAGTHIGVIGPNGAGKTTFLRALAGLDRYPDVLVTIDGKAMSDMPRHRVAQLIAFLPQNDEADPTFRVGDYIALASLAMPNWHDRMIRHAAERCGVAGMLDRKLGSLSGGERQKTMLARCLAQQPKILLLDEPTNHLDVASRIKMLQLVKGLPITTICVLHDLALLTECASRVLLFDAGGVSADGSPQNVFRSEAFQKALDLSVTECEVSDGRQAYVFAAAS